MGFSFIRKTASTGSSATGALVAANSLQPKKSTIRSVHSPTPHDEITRPLTEFQKYLYSVEKQCFRGKWSVLFISHHPMMKLPDPSQNFRSTYTALRNNVSEEIGQCCSLVTIVPGCICCSSSFAHVLQQFTATDLQTTDGVNWPGLFIVGYVLGTRR
jgi:hypothetical protein